MIVKVKSLNYSIDGGVDVWKILMAGKCYWWYSMSYDGWKKSTETVMMAMLMVENIDGNKK